MINRYDSPEISKIWNDTHKFETYLKVELALIRSLEGNLVPEGTSQMIKDKSQINPERIKEIEAVTKHDVIAFCSSITENIPEEIGKFFHFGCTSSDIIDTATNIQIKESIEQILPELKKLKETLLTKAKEHQNTVCMGRSHGMNAEPMSFGQKFLSFYAEISRRYSELENFCNNELTGQISGAVGNYTILNTDIEKQAIESLGLKVEDISSQVIPRDHIAKLVSINSLIASALERIAIEIRHLHHSDINEVNEGFSKGQKGSSIMPHKKNPISGENISGLARMIRSHLTVAHENILLWHERDISHSSAERMMLPDNLGLVFYTVKRMTDTIENLVVHTEAIENKVLSNFTYLSSAILHHILKAKDITRESAYAIVQAAAFDSKDAKSFIAHVVKNEMTKGIDFSEFSNTDIEGLRSIYLSQTQKVFERTIQNNK